jgi:hypothetical protein
MDYPGNAENAVVFLDPWQVLFFLSHSTLRVASPRKSAPGNS